MALRIIVYGHGDTSRFGFPTEEHMKRYLAGEIFSKYHGRYQFSQLKDADIVVLSRKGFAFGHFVVAAMESPNQNDITVYPRAKKTYLISESYRYQNPVKLSDLGVKGYQFGKRLSTRDFSTIQQRAGTIHRHVP